MKGIKVLLVWVRDLAIILILGAVLGVIMAWPIYQLWNTGAELLEGVASASVLQSFLAMMAILLIVVIIKTICNLLDLLIHEKSDNTINLSMSDISGYMNDDDEIEYVDEQGNPVSLSQPTMKN